ncbi:MAG: hypothetical protein RSD27_10945, partial [Ruthenibacterium sp.]
IILLLGGLLVLPLMGAPLAHVISGNIKNKMEPDSFWSLAVFAGYGVITFFTKLFVLFADVPVKYTAWPLLAIGVAAFAYVLFRAKKGGTLRMLRPSWYFIAILLAITVLVSVSYIATGAQFYTGYGHTDNFYYGTHAESLKEIPFSQTDTYWQNQPYTLCGIGSHRISRGLYQAFAAALFFVDGPSTLGLIGILSTPLVFCALIYTTRDVEMKRWMRYAGCAFASVLPGYVSQSLEGFYVVSLFTAMIAFLCKLLPDLFDGCHWGKTLAIAVIFESIVYTFFEGIALPVGLLMIALVVSLLSYRCNWRAIFHSLAILAIGFAANKVAPVEQLQVASTSLNSRGLDILCPAASSVELWPWLYFGKDFAANPVGGPHGFAYMWVLVMLSIAILVVGLVGLLRLFFKSYTPESILMLILAISPVLFLFRRDGETYQFYKMAGMALPVYVFGAWYFASDACEQVKQHFLGKQQNAFERILRKVVIFCIPAFFLCVFGYSTLHTFRKVMVISGGNPYYAEGRCELLPEQELAERNAYYSGLENRHDKNLVLAGLPDMSSWWSLYYARHNNLYFLTPEQLRTYDYGRTENVPRYTVAGIRDIPLDCEIIVEPYTRNLITDPELAKDYYLWLTAFSAEPVLNKKTQQYECAYAFRGFARTAAQVVLNINLLAEENVYPAEITVNGKTTVLKNADDFAVVEFEMQPGGYDCPAVISIAADQAMEPRVVLAEFSPRT